MNNLININEYPVNEMLKYLLVDKTTKDNIIFATDMYGDEEHPILPTDQITEEILKSGLVEIQPRVCKSRSEQDERTKAKAEIFTPSWICNKMNNHCDEEWFGKKNVFNTELDQKWRMNNRIVQFPDGKTWQDYVQSMRIEITCGEAPYLVSRYDTATGDIIDINRRIGILDRKLRIVNENTQTEEDWLLWVQKAYQSVYGFEFQGDNLLIARINLLTTFVEYLQDRWHRVPTKKELRTIANIISWNVWQMDGISGAVPFKEVTADAEQFDLFNFLKQSEKQNFNCRIYDWKANKSKEYNSVREGN